MLRCPRRKHLQRPSFRTDSWLVCLFFMLSDCISLQTTISVFVCSEPAKYKLVLRQVLLYCANSLFGAVGAGSTRGLLGSPKKMPNSSRVYLLPQHSREGLDLEKSSTPSCWWRRSWRSPPCHPVGGGTVGEVLHTEPFGGGI